MQAAVGLAQIDRLPGFIDVRKQNFHLLNDGLAEFGDVFELPHATPNSDPSWFGYPITVRDDAPFHRDEILRYLNQHRIGTRLLFAGNLTRQPYKLGRNFRTIGDLPNADRIMRQWFWIGVYPGLDKSAIDYVLDHFGKFVQGGVRV